MTTKTPGPGLARAVEQARRLATAVEAAHKAVGGDDLHAAVEKLKIAREAFGALVPDAEGWEAMAREWTTTIERRYLELEADLRRDCEALGWHIDGHWPELYIARAIGIKFDEKGRSAAVGSRALNRVDSKSLIAVLKPLVQELIPKKFSPIDFVQALSEAYDEVRGSTAQVGILPVYRAFVLRLQKPRFWRDARQEAFIGMSVDQFRARLTNILEVGMIRSRDGRELRLVPPIDPSDAIFLYQPSERRFGHVGRIEFSST